MSSKFHFLTNYRNPNVFLRFYQTSRNLLVNLHYKNLGVFRRTISDEKFCWKFASKFPSRLNGNRLFVWALAWKINVFPFPTKFVGNVRRISLEKYFSTKLLGKFSYIYTPGIHHLIHKFYSSTKISFPPLNSFEQNSSI